MSLIKGEFLYKRLLYRQGVRYVYLTLNAHLGFSIHITDYYSSRFFWNKSKQFSDWVSKNILFSMSSTNWNTNIFTLYSVSLTALPVKLKSFKMFYLMIKYWVYTKLIWYLFYVLLKITRIYLHIMLYFCLILLMIVLTICNISFFFQTKCR